MDAFMIGAQLLLAAVFAVAGGAKLFDLPGSRRAAQDFGLPGGVAAVVGTALPFVELATAVSLLFHPSARWGALAALVLLLAFMAGIANAMRRGRAPDCNCFGQVHSAPAGPWTLARNAVLAVIAASVVWYGPAPAIDDWVAGRSALELVIVGLIVVALVLAALAFRRRSRERARSVVLSTAQSPPSSAPEPEPAGLPVGTTAPGFALQDLRGRTQTLDSLRARGRPVVLEFIDLSCAPCRSFLPFLARWQKTLADRVTIAIITRGSVDDRPAWDAYGVADVLLDNSDEVFDAFRVDGTPKAMGIWQDGTVAAAPAGGMHMPEVLVRILIKGKAVHEGRAPSASPLMVQFEPGRS
jgi:thiol-disulfide isomerase/thioredoxin